MKKLSMFILAILLAVTTFARNVGPTEQLLNISATNYMYLADIIDETFFYLDKDSNGNRTVFTIGNRTGEVGDYSFAFGEFPIAAGLFSHAEGFFPNATNDYSYVWNGDTSKINYGSHGIGTYSVNPVGDLKGFYIGDHNLYEYIITNAITLLVQSDWAVTETNDLAYIKNKPTNVSQFNNDAEYIILSQVPDGQVQSDWNAIETIPVEVEEGEEPQTKPNPAYIQNKPTTVGTFENDVGYIIGSQVPMYQTNADWNAQEFKFDSDGNTIYITDDEGHLVPERNPSFIKNKPTFVSKFKNDRGYISILNGVEPKFNEGINILTLKAPQAAGGQTSTDICIPRFPTNLSELNDVDLSETVENGQLLTYRDGNWTNETLTIPQPTTTLSALTDVDLAESVEAGQVLTYDAEAQKWTNAPASGGSEVSWTQVSFENGTKIAEIQIDDNESIDVCIPNTNAYVQKSGDIMTGALTNSVGLAIGEGASIGENANVFVFNGDNSSPYSSSADGTFNVNSTNGIEGFYIGESNVYQIVFERLLNIISDKQYSQAKNVDELISNEKDLWDAITEFADYNNTLRTATTDRPVETRDISQPSLLGASGSTTTIFTNSYFDGHYETNNIVAFYPFYAIGQKFLNFGVDGSAGNVTMFGLTDRWTGTDPNSPPPGNNDVCEAMRVDTDGFTRSGAASVSSYDPLGSTNKFTIMGWVYRNDDYSASRVLADLAGTTKGDGIQIRFAGSSGTIRLFINPNDSNDYAESSGTISPSSKKWHHIAISFDSSREGTLEDRTVNFFVDGEKKNKPQSQANYKQGDAGIVAANTAPFTLGCASGADSYNQQLLGLLDDVIIFRGWTPLDYIEIVNPATGLNWSENEIVQFWMNMNDSILGKPDISGLGVNFGQFDPAESIYSVQEVNKLIGITDERAVEIIGHEPITFGQTNPRTSIYSAENIEDLYDEYYHP